MAENKTKPTEGDVAAFIAAIPDPGQRADAEVLSAMMARVTGQAPLVWDNKMVGFGTYSYKTGAGHKGQWIRTGFAPRKGALTVHLMDGVKSHAAALARLGPYKSGVSCLYIKRLADVDASVLEEVVAASYAAMNRAFPEPGSRAMLAPARFAAGRPGWRRSRPRRPRYRSTTSSRRFRFLSDARMRRSSAP